MDENHLEVITVLPGCNEKQLFKIGYSYSLPSGIIIRILKRRKSFDGFVVKKRRLYQEITKNSF